jgi:hypothetical protein
MGSGISHLRGLSNLQVDIKDFRFLRGRNRDAASSSYQRLQIGCCPTGGWIMKTKVFLAAVIFAANCTMANAQVLGGSVVGGAGGALGGSFGGVHDIGAGGHGAANGAFGAGLDAGSLRRSTSDVAARASQRTRSTVKAARERTRSTASSARAASEAALAATHESAISAKSAAASDAAWSANSAIDTGRDATTANNVQTATHAAGSVASVGRNDDLHVDQSKSGTSAASASAAFDNSAGTSLTPEAGVPMNATGDAAASGEASAAKEGVRADGKASATGNVALGE